MSDAKPEMIASPSRFLNRELSWLAFNTRVMEEADNAGNPLLERVNFLSISASNLDEFTMVRVAGIKHQARHAVPALSDDGLTPDQQLKLIHERVEMLTNAQQQCWTKLCKALAAEDIRVIGADELLPAELSWLEHYFMHEIFPVLTPIAIDPAHPFPFMPNLGIAQLFLFTGHKGREQVAIIPFPPTLPRFIRLPGEAIRLIPLEACTKRFFEALFPTFAMLDATIFRVTRDSDLDVEEGAQDLVSTFERAVKTRRRGRIVRVKLAHNASDAMHQFVSEHLLAPDTDLVTSGGLVGLASLRELVDLPRPDLKFPEFQARFPERINDFGGDCFAAIEAKDILVHHPFESFDVVVQFLRQAADDPGVVSIKQTLYRTSKDSPIVKALIAAAEAGKSVTAVIELKARFDEEANIKWARDLERVGVQVVYGFVKLKTHAKVSLVTRRVAGGLRSYVHYGTGNYHPATARLYTDLSFFTSDPTLCQDAAYFFNFVTGYARPKGVKKLFMAPKTLRSSLLELIEAEAAHAKAGRPAQIWAKMNALVDPAVIDALYAASRAGVKIELIVRGICCLRPGVKGLSENIRVKSIVGRFLEHARIACFGAGHGLPSPEAKLYIGSADWMPRNFDHRVEVMVPIENKTVHEQIIGQIMSANLKDQRQSWKLQSNGDYLREPHDGESFSAHEYFMTNPSLSGRGKAVKAKRPKEAPPKKKRA